MENTDSKLQESNEKNEEFKTEQDPEQPVVETGSFKIEVNLNFDKKDTEVSQEKGVSQEKVSTDQWEGYEDQWVERSKHITDWWSNGFISITMRGFYEDFDKSRNINTSFMLRVLDLLKTQYKNKGGEGIRDVTLWFDGSALSNNSAQNLLSLIMSFDLPNCGLLKVLVKETSVDHQTLQHLSELLKDKTKLPGLKYIWIEHSDFQTTKYAEQIKETLADEQYRGWTDFSYSKMSNTEVSLGNPA